MKKLKIPKTIVDVKKDYTEPLKPLDKKNLKGFVYQPIFGKKKV